jgi:solute carrier family 25 phosphate transporter 23/24/25/41
VLKQQQQQYIDWFVAIPACTLLVLAGSIRSYFKGNGTNVLKIAPETSIKLALNDRLKRHIHEDSGDITPWQRMVCGGVSGAVGQVGLLPTAATAMAAVPLNHLKQLMAAARHQQCASSSSE